MEVFYFIGAVVGIIVCASVASEFRRIATMKGHDEAKYFWWTFFLGPVGMLMVIALPQKTNEPVAEVSASDELPYI